MSRITDYCKTVPGMPKVLNKCLLTDEYIGDRITQWWRATFTHSFFCSWTFFVLPVRFWEMHSGETFLGLSTIASFRSWLWIPSSGLTAALILTLGGQCLCLVLGLAGIWLEWAPGTRRLPLPPWGHSGMDEMALCSLALTYLCPWCQLPSIRVCTCQSASFRVGLFLWIPMMLTGGVCS